MRELNEVERSSVFSAYEQKGYILDTSKLQDGDIILEHGYSKISPFIELATNCHYTHAMIYLEGTIIEATGEGGVFSRVPDRFSVPFYNDLKVLRLREPAHESLIRLIINTARELTGSSYSVKEAVRVSVKSKKSNKEAKNINKYQFCSRLVAQCYQKANIDLVRNVEYCSPKDIFKSDLLHEVVDAVKEATSRELEHAKSGVLHPVHLKSSVKWTKEAKKILKKRNIEVQTTNEIIRAVIMLKDVSVDKNICKIIRSSGYLDNYLDDKIENPYRYNVDLFIEMFNKYPELIEPEVDKEVHITNLYVSNFIESREMYDEHRIGVLKVFLELYENLLLIIEERLLIIVKVCEINKVHSPSKRLAEEIILVIQKVIG